MPKETQRDQTRNIFDCRHDGPVAGLARRRPGEARRCDRPYGRRPGAGADRRHPADGDLRRRHAHPLDQRRAQPRQGYQAGDRSAPRPADQDRGHQQRQQRSRPPRSSSSRAISAPPCRSAPGRPRRARPSQASATSTSRPRPTSTSTPAARPFPPKARARSTISPAKALATDGYAISVLGFADPTGNAEANQRLSARRAQNVINYLKQKPRRSARQGPRGLGDGRGRNRIPGADLECRGTPRHRAGRHQQGPAGQPVSIAIPPGRSGRVRAVPSPHGQSPSRSSSKSWR